MDSTDVINVVSSSEEEQISNVINKSSVNVITDKFNEIFVDQEWLKNKRDFPYSKFKTFLTDIKINMEKQNEKTKWYFWRHLLELLKSINISGYDLKKDVKYNIILGNIMAEYINYRCSVVQMEIIDKKITQSELEHVHEVIESNLILIFEGNYEHISFALMQIKSDKRNNAVLFPLFKNILEHEKAKFKHVINHISYVRLLLCFRRWQSISINLKNNKVPKNDSWIIRETISKILPSRIPESDENTKIFLDILPSLDENHEEHATRLLLKTKLLNVDKAVSSFFDVYIDHYENLNNQSKSNSSINNLSSVNNLSSINNSSINNSSINNTKSRDISSTGKSSIIVIDVESSGKEDEVEIEERNVECISILSGDDDEINNSVVSNNQNTQISNSNLKTIKTNSNIIFSSSLLNDNSSKKLNKNISLVSNIKNRENINPNKVIFSTKMPNSNENASQSNKNDIEIDADVESDECENESLNRGKKKKHRKHKTKKYNLNGLSDSDNSLNDRDSIRTFKYGSNLGLVTSTTNSDVIPLQSQEDAQKSLSRSRESTQSPHISTSTVFEVDGCFGNTSKINSESKILSPTRNTDENNSVQLVNGNSESEIVSTDLNSKYSSENPTKTVDNDASTSLDNDENNKTKKLSENLSSVSSISSEELENVNNKSFLCSDVLEDISSLSETDLVNDKINDNQLDLDLEDISNDENIPKSPESPFDQYKDPAIPNTNEDAVDLQEDQSELIKSDNVITSIDKSKITDNNTSVNNRNSAESNYVFEIIVHAINPNESNDEMSDNGDRTSQYDENNIKTDSLYKSLENISNCIANVESKEDFHKENYDKKQKSSHKNILENDKEIIEENSDICNKVTVETNMLSKLNQIEKISEPENNLIVTVIESKIVEEKDSNDSIKETNSKSSESRTEPDKKVDENLVDETFVTINNIQNKDDKAHEETNDSNIQLEETSIVKEPLERVKEIESVNIETDEVIDESLCEKFSQKIVSDTNIVENNSKNQLSDVNNEIDTKIISSSVSNKSDSDPTTIDNQLLSRSDLFDDSQEKQCSNIDSKGRRRKPKFVRKVNEEFKIKTKTDKIKSTDESTTEPNNIQVDFSNSTNTEQKVSTPADNFEGLNILATAIEKLEKQEALQTNSVEEEIVEDNIKSSNLIKKDDKSLLTMPQNDKELNISNKNTTNKSKNTTILVKCDKYEDISSADENKSNDERYIDETIDTTNDERHCENKKTKGVKKKRSTSKFKKKINLVIRNSDSDNDNDNIKERPKKSIRLKTFRSNSWDIEFKEILKKYDKIFPSNKQFNNISVFNILEGVQKKSEIKILYALNKIKFIFFHRCISMIDTNKTISPRSMNAFLKKLQSLEREKYYDKNLRALEEEYKKIKKIDKDFKENENILHFDSFLKIWCNVRRKYMNRLKKKQKILYNETLDYSESSVKGHSEENSCEKKNSPIVSSEHEETLLNLGKKIFNKPIDNSVESSNFSEIDEKHKNPAIIMKDIEDSVSHFDETTKDIIFNEIRSKKNPIDEMNVSSISDSETLELNTISTVQSTTTIDDNISLKIDNNIENLNTSETVKVTKEIKITETMVLKAEDKPAYSIVHMIEKKPTKSLEKNKIDKRKNKQILEEVNKTTTTLPDKKPTENKSLDRKIKKCTKVLPAVETLDLFSVFDKIKKIESPKTKILKDKILKKNHEKTFEHNNREKIPLEKPEIKIPSDYTSSENPLKIKMTKSIEADMFKRKQQFFNACQLEPVIMLKNMNNNKKNDNCNSNNKIFVNLSKIVETKDDKNSKLKTDDMEIETELNKNDIVKKDELNKSNSKSKKKKKKSKSNKSEKKHVNSKQIIEEIKESIDKNLLIQSNKENAVNEEKTIDAIVKYKKTKKKKKSKNVRKSKSKNVIIENEKDEFEEKSIPDDISHVINEKVNDENSLNESTSNNLNKPNKTENVDKEQEMKLNNIPELIIEKVNNEISKVEEEKEENEMKKDETPEENLNNLIVTEKVEQEKDFIDSNDTLNLAIKKGNDEVDKITKEYVKDQPNNDSHNIIEIEKIEDNAKLNEFKLVEKEDIIVENGELTQNKKIEEQNKNSNPLIDDINKNEENVKNSTHCVREIPKIVVDFYESENGIIKKDNNEKSDEPIQNIFNENSNITDKSDHKESKNNSEDLRNNSKVINNEPVVLEKEVLENVADDIDKSEDNNLIVLDPPSKRIKTDEKTNENINTFVKQNGSAIEDHDYGKGRNNLLTPIEHKSIILSELSSPNTFNNNLLDNSITSFGTDFPDLNISQSGKNVDQDVDLDDFFLTDNILSEGVVDFDLPCFDITSYGKNGSDFLNAVGLIDESTICNQNSISDVSSFHNSRKDSLVGGTSIFPTNEDSNWQHVNMSIILKNKHSFNTEEIITEEIQNQSIDIFGDQTLEDVIYSQDDNPLVNQTIEELGKLVNDNEKKEGNVNTYPEKIISNFEPKIDPPPKIQENEDKRTTNLSPINELNRFNSIITTSPSGYSATSSYSPTTPSSQVYREELTTINQDDIRCEGIQNINSLIQTTQKLNNFDIIEVYVGKPNPVKKVNPNMENNVKSNSMNMSNLENDGTNKKMNLFIEKKIIPQAKIKPQTIKRKIENNDLHTPIKKNFNYGNTINSYDSVKPLLNTEKKSLDMPYLNSPPSHHSHNKHDLTNSINSTNKTFVNVSKTINSKNEMNSFLNRNVNNNVNFKKSTNIEKKIYYDAFDYIKNSKNEHEIPKFRPIYNDTKIAVPSHKCNLFPNENYGHHTISKPKSSVTSSNCRKVYASPDFLQNLSDNKNKQIQTVREPWSPEFASNDKLIEKFNKEAAQKHNNR